MKTVYKYELLATDVQNVKMPIGAKPLSVGYQTKPSYNSGIGLNQLCLWCEVETDNQPHYATVYIIGTGHLIPDGMVSATFVGRASLPGLEFHIWIKSI